MKIIGGCKLACFSFFFLLLIVDVRSFYLNTDELARLKQKNNADITNKLEFFFDDDDEASGSRDGEERKDSRIISPSLKEFPGSFQVRLNANNKSHLLKFNKILRSPEESNKQSIFTLDSKTRKPFKYMDASVGEEFELYKQQNGKGIATLIRNKHWNGLSSSSASATSSSLNSKQPFRMVSFSYFISLFFLDPLTDPKKIHIRLPEIMIFYDIQLILRNIDIKLSSGSLKSFDFFFQSKFWIHPE